MTSLHDQFAQMSQAERDDVVSQATAVHDKAVAILDKQLTEDHDKSET